MQPYNELDPLCFVEPEKLSLASVNFTVHDNPSLPYREAKGEGLKTLLQDPEYMLARRSMKQLDSGTPWISEYKQC